MELVFCLLSIGLKWHLWYGKINIVYSAVIEFGFWVDFLSFHFPVYVNALLKNTGLILVKSSLVNLLLRGVVVHHSADILGLIKLVSNQARPQFAQILIHGPIYFLIDSLLCIL